MPVSLRHIIIYKVLKQPFATVEEAEGLRHIIIYKVLKQ